MQKHTKTYKFRLLYRWRNILSVQMYQGIVEDENFEPNEPMFKPFRSTFIIGIQLVMEFLNGLVLNASQNERIDNYLPIEIDSFGYLLERFTPKPKLIKESDP
jgi:hypothetical protein